MSIRVRKVVYQVHMDRLDEDGNVVDELSTQDPITIYAHQLDQLPEQVQAVVMQAEAQAADPEPAPNGNRAQRRAKAKAS